MTAHSRPPHDEDDDLDLRALYRSLPRTEPAREVDAAVREQAAGALAADRRAQRQRRLWHPGWGVAASIVLTASLFLLVDPDDRDPAVMHDAQVADAPPPSAAPAPAPAAPARMRQLAPPAAQGYAQAPRPAEARPSIERADREPSMQARSADTASPDAASAQAQVEARIEHIRALLKSGEKEAARRAARALHDAHPALALPADLQPLLGQAEQ
ncbi:hypothetical protein [Bordetella petrii]|uniref:hypothetical protein n=1 Tax=Bordetella petrii TaxID=94624 RepID=UPI00047E5056|nr:hypothetical protein [Bordetella petrii]